MVGECQLDTHSSTAYAVCMYVLYLLLRKKGPTLVGLTISKYKEQIVIYNNALSVHTSVISHLLSILELVWLQTLVLWLVYIEYLFGEGRLENWIKGVNMIALLNSDIIDLCSDDDEMVEPVEVYIFSVLSPRLTWGSKLVFKLTSSQRLDLSALPFVLRCWVWMQDKIGWEGKTSITSK